MSEIDLFGTTYSTDDLTPEQLSQWREIQTDITNTTNAETLWNCVMSFPQIVALSRIGILQKSKQLQDNLEARKSDDSST